MARKLIIVARQHPDLYDYLRKRLAERRIEVILDRRLGERRRQTVAVAAVRGFISRNLSKPGRKVRSFEREGERVYRLKL